MEEKKKNSLYKSFMLVIITALITCIITTIVVYNCVNKSPNNSMSKNVIGGMISSLVNTWSGNNENKTIDEKISDIDKKLEELYIGEIDKEKLIESALEGYVSGLGDEYTEYLTESEIQSLMEDVNGSYVGVGLYIAQNAKTNEILVIGVIEDSPAAKAGILAGDVVEKVDDVQYTGEQLTQASNKMKGVEGTNVKITIKRNDEEMDFDIVRQTIKFNCVKSEKLENNIGYIKISSFDGGCADDFEKEYKQLESQGIKSLIIDLRNNGGGLVDESLKIAELIVPKGSKMLITKDKSEKEDVSISKKEPIINMPIVILVNGYTASASEILTAAVKENTDAKVVGTQTYGKGIIQGIFLFNDKKTGMKITMQEYFTPNHSKLHKIGIKPDVELDLPDEWKGQSNVERKFDNQLNKALEILK